jgi:ornithine cyclodeaminase/alanine dehydrogenase-like protein (mu-crystallin family)
MRGASEPPPLLFLGRDEVVDLLPIPEAIEAMAAAFAALAAGRAVQPLRSALWLPDRRGLLGTMPAHLEITGAGDGGAPAYLSGAKVVSVFPGNHAAGLDSHQGLVLLFESEHGRPLAVADAATITALRTAAVSALATRLLARPGLGETELALLGSGVQAETHLEAIRAVRPLARARVWSRSPERARRFAVRLSERHGLPVEAMPTAEAAVAGAGIVCTVTAAREPVLRGDWLAPGTHVNAVGSCAPTARELDARAIARARLFVDSRESALAEAGDLLLAIAEGAVAADHIAGELGDLVAGRVAGRTAGQTGDGEITLFESLGLGIEDVAATHHVYRKALAAGRGRRLDLSAASA